MTWKSYLATLSGRSLTTACALSFAASAYMAYRGPGDYVFKVIGVVISVLVCVGIISLGMSLGGRGLSATILVCVSPFLGMASFLTLYFSRHWGTTGVAATGATALVFLVLAIRPPSDGAAAGNASEA